MANQQKPATTGSFFSSTMEIMFRQEWISKNQSNQVDLLGAWGCDHQTWSHDDLKLHREQTYGDFRHTPLKIGSWCVLNVGLLGVAGMMKLIVMTGMIPENSLRKTHQ